MRVDSRDFKDLEITIKPIINSGIENHDDYIDNEESPNSDDSEALVRIALQEVIDGI